MTARECIPDSGQLIRPDIGMLHPSPSNPRKHFDGAALQDLADSIRANDILQPILVRVMPQDMAQRLNTLAQLEIVAGERRWRAAQIAGLQDVPCILRDLSDEQVLRLQVIENLQREGLNPIEEAEGFGALRATGMTPQQIADSIGKSKAYVHGKLKLLALSAPCRDALGSGDLMESVALLIARIPVPELQAQALELALERDDYTNERPSFRQIRPAIEGRFTRNLVKAPFDPADATLLPAAGACSTCAHNLYNMPDHTGTGANVCTHTACYNDKCSEHNVRLLDAPADTPRVNIASRGGAACTYADYDEAGYRQLKGINHHDPKHRSYAQWLADNNESTPTAIHVCPRTGNAILIASKADLAAAAERMAARQADQDTQPRLDVATEQPAPASAPAPIPGDAPEDTPAPRSKNKTTRAGQPRPDNHDPAAGLRVKYQKYRNALAFQITAHPPLMISGPLLHTVARFISRAHAATFDSDGQAMGVILNTIATDLANNPIRVGPDTLEILAEDLGINFAEILDHYIPAPEGCARPNENGVFTAQDVINIASGKTHVEIRIARCPDGWRASHAIKTATGSSSGPICITDPAYPDRDAAIKAEAHRVIEHIARDSLGHAPAAAKAVLKKLNELVEAAELPTA